MLTNQTAVLIELHDPDIGEAVVDFADGQSGQYDVVSSCEKLDSDWLCSNGTQSLSLCLKSCVNGDTEQSICMCQESSCSWYQKTNKCAISTDGHPPSTTAIMESPNEINSPGNSPFENISSSESKNGLMSLIHEINLSNSGSINVNFNLK